MFFVKVIKFKATHNFCPLTYLYLYNDSPYQFVACSGFIGLKSNQKGFASERSTNLSPYSKGNITKRLFFGRDYFSPIPETRFKSSALLNAPFLVLSATIASAFLMPTPESEVAIVLASAVFIFTGVAKAWLKITQ